MTLITRILKNGTATAWTALIIASTLAWSFHLLSFLHAKDLVLAIGLPLVAWLQYRSKVSVSLKGFLQIAPLWLGLLIWGVSGMVTAQVPSYLLENIIRWLLILTAAALILANFDVFGGRRWLYNTILGAGAAVSALALLQYAGLITLLLPVFPGYDQPAYSVFGNQDLLGGYTAFTLVLFLSLWFRSKKRKRGFSLFQAMVFALLLAALIVSSSRSAWLAAALGGLSIILLPGGIQRLRRSLRARHRNALFLLLLVAMALLALSAAQLYERSAASFSEDDVGGHARLWFWAGAADMIRDHPWLGVGLGQFAYWSPSYQGRVLWAPGGETYYHNELHTDHAHGELLDWMSETGIAGILCWIVFFILTFRKRNPALPALITLGVFGLFNSFSHSTPHVLAMLLFAVPKDSVTARPLQLPRFALLCLTLLAALTFVATTVIPSALLCRAEQAHLAGNSSGIYYEKALAWHWPNYRAHENYGLALFESEDYKGAWEHLLLAKKGSDTGRIYYLLGLCAAAREDQESIRFYARQCLLRWPGNRHMWTLLLAHCPREERATWEMMQEKFVKGKGSE